MALPPHPSLQAALADALSGEKRRLGFVFLYELLRGDVRLQLLPSADAAGGSGAGPASVSGPAHPTLRDDWACSVCTVINTGTSTACTVCGSPAPGAGGSGGSGGGGAEWECGLCTSRNPPGAAACGVCGRAKGGWACPACTVFNDGTAAACGTCGGPKPPAPLDPASVATFDGAGGAGSSWTLGKLLCQMLYLSEVR